MFDCLWRQRRNRSNGGQGNDDEARARHSQVDSVELPVISRIAR